MTSPVDLAAATPVATAYTFTAPTADRSAAYLPETPHPAYERMRPRLELCRALMAGTDAIRDGGDTYLPILDGESDQSYKFRKVLCALFPGFARTVKAAVGLINQSPPVLGDDMPEAITALAENIDMAGTHLNVLTKTLTKHGIVDGFAGILVDYPRVENPSQVSADEERRQGLRPYWVLIQASDVLKTVYSTVNGIRTLVQLVIRETSEEIVGDFGLATVTRYRVYRQTAAGVTAELWERKQDEAVSHQVETPLPMRNVSAIPWAPFGAGEEVSSVEWRPALLDLAYLNIEHHQVKTNMRNLETLACVPTMVRVGATQDENGNYPPIRLGPRSSIEVPALVQNPNPVRWLTPDVTVLDPANRSLQDIKADMGSAGLAFLAPDTRSAETAAAKRIDSTAQNATITTVAGKLQDCLEMAFVFTAQYMRLATGSVTINQDFENTVMDAAMVTALGGLAAQGKLDIETLLDLLENGHILPDGTDKEAILSRILKENAALNVMPTPRQPGSGSTDTPAPPGGNVDQQTGDATQAAA